MAVLAVFATFLFSLLLTPVAKRVAWRIGAIDCPLDWRRMHKKSTPRDGGIAFFTAILVGVCLLFRFDAIVIAALGGGLIVFFLGLIDDIRHLSAGVKLSVQVFAATIALLLFGEIEGVALFGALLWILALTNAHNFVDGLDGLLGGTSVIEGIGLSLLLFFTGWNYYQIPLLIAAACLGFLWYNRPPAQIFAGDCGSQSVGFLFAVLSLPLLRTPQWLFGGLAPLFIFAYPLTDLFAAVLRRFLRRKNPFSADRAHLHHRLAATGLSHKGCTGILFLLSASLCALGVALGREDGIYAALLVIPIALLFLFGIRRFLIHFAKSG